MNEIYIKKKLSLLDFSSYFSESKGRKLVNRVAESARLDAAGADVLLPGEVGKLSVDGNAEPLEPGMTYLVPAASSVIQIEGRRQVLWIRLL